MQENVTELVFQRLHSGKHKAHFEAVVKNWKAQLEFDEKVSAKFIERESKSLEKQAENNPWELIPDKGDDRQIIKKRR